MQLKIYGTTFDTYVLGDDSIFGIPEELGFPDLQHIAETLNILGLDMRPDKAVVAIRPDEFEFLGHAIHGTKISR